MNNAIVNFPAPANEPVKAYLEGSPERIALDAELKRQFNTVVDIPIIIGGKEIRTGNTGNTVQYLMGNSCLRERAIQVGSNLIDWIGEVTARQVEGNLILRSAAVLSRAAAPLEQQCRRGRGLKGNAFVVFRSKQPAWCCHTGVLPLHFFRT